MLISGFFVLPGRYYTLESIFFPEDDSKRAFNRSNVQSVIEFRK